MEVRAAASGIDALPAACLAALLPTVLMDASERLLDEMLLGWGSDTCTCQSWCERGELCGGAFRCPTTGSIVDVSVMDVSVTPDSSSRSNVNDTKMRNKQTTN